jgi:hypothetical protein
MRKWFNRLRAAWSVLRGRPTAYGLRLLPGPDRSALRPSGACQIIDCEFPGGPRARHEVWPPPRLPPPPAFGDHVTGV